jgi:hypothetical protein
MIRGSYLTGHRITAWLQWLDLTGPIDGGITPTAGHSAVAIPFPRNACLT